MKKLNKLIAVLTAMAMVLALSIVSVFAEGEETSNEALLVKYLKLAEGESVPNATFTFTWTGVESSTITAAEAEALKPTNVTISTSDMEKTTFASDGATVAGTLKVADLFDLDDFTKPGVYKYEVTEEESGLAQNDDGTMSYNVNDSTYLITVYVTRDTTTGELDISNIVVQEEDENGDVDEKEDATHDPTADPEDEDEADPVVTTTNDISDQGFTFVNSYTSDVTIAGDEGIFNVSKAIDGEFADPTAEFPFVITLTIPEESSTTTVTYKKGSTTTTTTAAQYANKVITINETLKHGEKLVFNTLPAGTTWAVNEDLNKSTTTGEGAEAVTTYAVKNYDKYTASAKVTDTGAEAQPAEETATNAGADLAVNGLIADTDTANKAAYTNTYEDESTTPTGILINNLPYIALALVAIGGLVAYVVVRRRQDDEA